jgi:hypothetical protein
MEAVVARAVRDRAHAEQLLQAAQKARRMVSSADQRSLSSYTCCNQYPWWGIRVGSDACARSAASRCSTHSADCSAHDSSDRVVLLPLLLLLTTATTVNSALD